MPNLLLPRTAFLGGVYVLLAAAQVSVVTYHNDNLRTGLNPKETILTPTSVNVKTFGKKFSYTVDGRVYTQPLYMQHVAISGRGTHNVVFVATENDSVYAFDADTKGGGGQGDSFALWHAAFLRGAGPVKVATVPSSDVSCTSTSPNIGITSTPVIDPASGTIYVIAATKETAHGTTSYFQRLHALSISSGAEKFGGPFTIKASVPGTCLPNSSGQVEFGALRQQQRAGLTLSPNGTLYAAWASYCDKNPYNGWVMAFSAQTGKLLSAFNSAPDEGTVSYECRAGFWQSGAAPGLDSAGNLYLASGNGYFNADSGGRDYGDSQIKLTMSGTGLSVADYFTPYNQASLDAADLDLGSGGVLLLPDQPGAHPHLSVNVGKEGTIYLVDRDNMGKYNASGDTQIVQVLPNAIGQVFGMPAYFNGTVYFGGQNDSIKAFPLNNGLLATTPSSKTTTVYSHPGPTPSISANGTTNGILWALETSNYGTGGPAILHAYDAANLANELYNTTQNAGRDQLGQAVKYVVPTVANGKVYIATENELSVYGPL